jgi:hypothetical protein
MGRLDLLPNNTLATLLRELEETIRTYKNRQNYSGTSGLRGYFVQTANTWDITGNVNTGNPSMGSQRGFEIIFTASGKQPFPIESVQLDIRFGGTGDANKPVELPNGFYGYDDGVNFAGMFERNPQFDKTYSDNETQYRWTFDFDIYGNLDYYIKVYASGSSDGEIEVNQVFP